MIDFVEYVISELSSRRLSKTDALALIKQFHLRAKHPAQASVIHPLLHENTSDLDRQGFATALSGDEFFLRDHRVDGRSVLPGVAYLEMARVAAETAAPALQEDGAIELRNVIWAQPIVVTQPRKVAITLLPNESQAGGRCIDYEVYTLEAAEEGSYTENIHSRGLVALVARPAPLRLDLQQLEAQMKRGELDAAGIYTAYEKMGISYGPAHRALMRISQGEGQLLARMSLPAAAAFTLDDYLLHPSLMDAAIQAAVGFIDDIVRVPDRPAVPFALESLRILGRCTQEMVAWLRYSAGSGPDDRISKLDIDLCDPEGNVCVQMCGFSSRELRLDLNPAGHEADQPGVLYAVPGWELEPKVAPAAAVHSPDCSQRHVVLCGLPNVRPSRLESLIASGTCVSWPARAGQNVAERYSEVALGCFELIKTALQGGPQGQVLIQLVIGAEEDEVLLRGISAVFKTAAIENPAITGQIIVAEAQSTAEELADRLQLEKDERRSLTVSYERGTRHVLKWRELTLSDQPVEIAFKDRGVYLITGGLGGLGSLCAREITQRTQHVRVILTGRAALTPARQAALETLSSPGSTVEYRQMDVADRSDVQRVIGQIVAESQGLSGIVHCAGMISDSLIVNKTSAEFRRVLEPKVAGTLNLDAACNAIHLDFVVLFSGGASVTGNVGQADYAAANGFMDQFAEYRNRRVAAGQRHGKTVAINWPLWQEGGMQVDAASLQLVKTSVGLHPMRTATGLQAFHRSLQLQHAQIQVVEGDLAKLRKSLFNSSAPAVEAAPAAGTLNASELQQRTQDFLKHALSKVLKLAPERIDASAAFEKYGIDSILMMSLIDELEKTFGSLPKTLFFEHQSLAELARYFINSHTARMAGLVGNTHSLESRSSPAGARSEQPSSQARVKSISSRRMRRRRPSAAATDTGIRAPAEGSDPIAIIGLSGRYPQAADIGAYWRNLREGRDCIVEVPKERWDWREYFSEDRTKEGHHYSRWGGFIEGVDEFDPLFFGISPREAKQIDPQERLFLQHVWMAMEDAGYTRAGLQVQSEQDLAGQVGVYVGVMYSEYQLFGAEANARGQRMSVSGSFASVANRVSYVLNLHGPSMTVDTMCSSSLTAIHIACQDLKQRRTSLAIAGGVNVSIHPNKYLMLSAGQFISSDGHCQSFGEGGNGYIPGEGVGVVLLKRLSEAERDGDHIYGIIRGSAVNHGGKTNGYTVPNPHAQTSVISRALSEAKIDARQISYIEAHGTGTKLGDPIEIAALSKAFERHTAEKGFCLIGSAKSNIGHCESAAGIAGLTKVLLQMQHRQIVPSLHSSRLNPHIQFEQTPFVVNQSLKAWEAPIIQGRQSPRIAGISSLGAGGSNAHIIVEEYVAAETDPARLSPPVIIVLSARTPEQLRQKVSDLLEYVREQEPSAIDLSGMAYTLQVGREAMEERLGLIVTTVEELAQKLQGYLSGTTDIQEVYQGQVRNHQEALSLFKTDADLQQTIDKWIGQKRLTQLLDLWVKGLELDWRALYGQSTPGRISLPSYPFAKERYWIDAAGINSPAAVTRTNVLHPLLHTNTSDLSRQSYSTVLSGQEFFLADHRVRLGDGSEKKVLPGVAYLEMARAAIERATPFDAETSVMELRGVVWAQPIVVNDEYQVGIDLWTEGEQQVGFEIHSSQETVHCQGRAWVGRQDGAERLQLDELRGQMQRGRLESDSVYAVLARMGLAYGPAHRALTLVEQGEGQLLAQLRLPSAVATGHEAYVLHPSLMDGALQAAIGLVQDMDARSYQPRVPYALESLRILSKCTQQMYAWVRYAPGSNPHDALVKVDIDLCDEHGKVCVEVRGFSARTLGAEEKLGLVLATPVWEACPVEGNASEYAEHHVVLCDMAQIDVAGLERLMPHSRWISLRPAAQQNAAERYREYALECFERVQSILKSKPQGKVLLQIVIGDSGEQRLQAGLNGLLRSASLENPQLVGQVILTSTESTAAELAQQVAESTRSAADPVIRYQAGTREVLRWRTVSEPSQTPPVAFREDGVYLITGGLGGLGVVFAREIVRQGSRAKVILTGRSELSAQKQAVLHEIPATPGQVTYRILDLTQEDQVQQLLGEIRQEHGQLNGIVHSAGMIADRFILQKTAAEFGDVLTPKVAGTWNLDRASWDLDLDFFVLFSSVAGAMGNVGQADYASANAFMDQFAAYRNDLVRRGERRGKTLSINWPLWLEGGMTLDASSQELLHRTTGMRPMRTVSGLQAFYQSVALNHSQMLVLEGDPARLQGLLAQQAPQSQATGLPEPVTSASADSDGTTDTLLEKTQDFLRRQLAAVLSLPSHRIDPRAPLENYGIDSVSAMNLTNQLEKTFGPLSKTLFFEYQTVAALAKFLLKTYPSIVHNAIAAAQAPAQTAAAATAALKPVARTSTSRRKSRFADMEPSRAVAVIGVSGRYPLADDLEQFWDNLRSGRNCITEIPAERWNNDSYYDPDRGAAGKIHSKWGGFLADVDKFDPLFFNISPREATLMDPQERLFLEIAWQTLEDAGYSKESLSGSRVGVYVGVMWGQYELFGTHPDVANTSGVPTSSYGSIANRVSYFLNLHGPSIALDTMCSSSLTAIHLASEAIRRGEIDAAIAGGVNVSIHPQKYLGLSQGSFVSSDGRCRSFGAGGDGYVPGEGVGAILLKSLDAAIRDGDQVYAVIRSSAVNHGGKTNGYTVPNPNAQASLILETLNKARIDPRTVGYVEAHGTGTSLGDPIEITGLRNAFAGSAGERQFCPIGSVKSNIGHLEAAAGIAAVTKALLQIRHEQLVPSLHAEHLNPHIDFEQSPFYVQTNLTSWERPAAHPRRVGVSSFGAGGSNAHLILEECLDVRTAEDRAPAAPEAFLLSARDQQSLRRYARKVADFLKNRSSASMSDMAYTTQVGRTPLTQRLAIIASSTQDLGEKLQRWLALQEAQGPSLKAGGAADVEDVYCGNARDSAHYTGDLIEGEAGRTFIEELHRCRDLTRLARLWILGVQIDWSRLDRPAKPRRVSLPTYPFEKQRYWVDSPIPLPALNNSQGRARVSPGAASQTRQSFYYAPQWKASALIPNGDASARQGQANGPMLILDASDELFLCMKQRWSGASGQSVVLAKAGGHYETPAPDIYTLDASQEEHFERLIADLQARRQLPSCIVHYMRASVPGQKHDLMPALSWGVYALLSLCKALMKHKHSTPVRIVSIFESSATQPAPHCAAIGGFLKTLHLENPRYFGKVVAIQDGHRVPIADQTDLILSELDDEHWGDGDIRHEYHDDVRGRACTRYIQQLTPCSPAVGAAADLPLKHNGVYIVTGGSGGLGFLFSEYLAEKFNARLVLVGRSAPGAEQHSKLARLQSLGGQAIYLQADVARLEDMQAVARETKARFRVLNGVIHAAGVNRDSFILKKTREQMQEVLSSKVYGTINLDQATSAEDLDLFVLFSSVAGVMGNPGQCDYAYANHFQDAFAESREHSRAAGARTGRTLSINWPLWEHGGMSISSSGVALLEEQTGMSPLPTAEGMRCWEELLRSDVSQAAVIYGLPTRIAAHLARETPAASNSPVRKEGIDGATVLERTEVYLKTLLGEQIRLAPDRIDSHERLEAFGIDSIMISRFNASLQRDLGELPKTLLYEHETVAELAKYLVQEAQPALVALLGATCADGDPQVKVTETRDVPSPHQAETHGANDDVGAIAIVGVHAKLPQCKTLRELWDNLEQGRDLTGLVPADRWDWEEFYHPDPTAAAAGKIYCKWGGFLDDCDKFDAGFFGITPEEARVIDPQERLFLQSVWGAIEDAGYTRASLKKHFPKGRSANVGVYVGVTTNSYSLLGPEEWSHGNMVSPASLPWSIANRVSYFFDFNGPSLPVDTACSSSLVAVHLACESLRKQECQMAIAGGVNLYLHPAKYQSLCNRRMLSTGGQCRSYGAGDDGFVPAEGVGALVLKPLESAIAHGDHIYAVIPGSAFSHSGRSNGYSAPNPNSQASLVAQALDAARIHPETIGYVEGHGTGTQLGDSLEITALTQAFRRQSTRTGFCALGSVKANIGHAESAAGIAAIAKVLLQLKHRQLVPTIHSEQVNPNIGFSNTPFYLQHALTPWESSALHPRRALINSFGAGGVNACLILQEYERSTPAVRPASADPQLIVLSARDEDRLRAYVDELLAHLEKEGEVDLANLAYTLQVGREPMSERMALVVTSVPELTQRLAEWTRHESTAGIHRGSLDPRRGARRSSSHSELLEGRDLGGLAQAWTAGEEVDWNSLYSQHRPVRISLPSYPFAAERHWISDSRASRRMAGMEGVARLHPLLSYNSSTLDEVSFCSVLSAHEFYAQDHEVNGQRVFPGSGFLEIACVSGGLAGAKKVRKLQDVVWIQPLLFRDESQRLQICLKPADDSAEYVITSSDEHGDRIAHSEGIVCFQDDADSLEAVGEESLPVEALKAQCSRRLEGADLYRLFEQSGISYGPAFRPLQELYVGNSFAVSRLTLAEHLRAGFDEFILHPCIIDGALQSVSGLIGAVEPAVPHLPFAIGEVQIIRPMAQTCYVHVEHAGLDEPGNGRVKKFDIRICNERGLVLVALRSFCVRALKPNTLSVPTTHHP